MKKVLFIVIILINAKSLLYAQKQSQHTEPIKWAFNTLRIGTNEFQLIVTANIADGWYLYSQDLKNETSLPTEFIDTVSTPPFKSFMGFFEVDLPVFDTLETELKEKIIILKYKKQANFKAFVVVNSPTIFSGHIVYQACTKEKCLMPQKVPFRFEVYNY